MSSFWLELPSPVGKLVLHATDTALTRLDNHHTGSHPSGKPHPNAILEQAARELTEYFAGTRKKFTVTLAPQGTDFQMRVWQAMRKIPFGHTMSYGQLAAVVGSPAASRAVGAACGRNPLMILIPCHRVLASDGSLHGFGGGLPMKEFLLKLEGVLL